MKKKALYLIITVLSLSLILFGVYKLKDHEQDLIVRSWIKAVKDKDLNQFSKFTDMLPIVDSITKGHNMYLSKTVVDLSDDQFVEIAKNNLLGFIYSKFSDDVLILLEGYFKNEKINTLLYSDNEILNFPKHIDWNSVKIEQTKSFDKNTRSYKITFFQSKLESSFDLNLKLKKSEDSWVVERFEQFNIFLAQYKYAKAKKLKQIYAQTKSDLDKTAMITEFETKTFSYFNDFGFSTKHRIKILNSSNRNILEFKLQIYTLDENGTKLYLSVKSYNQEIESGKNVEFHIQDVGADFYREMVYNGRSPKAEIVEIKTDDQHLIKYISDLDWED